jgi:hypothetical protein
MESCCHARLSLRRAGGCGLDAARAGAGTARRSGPFDESVAPSRSDAADVREPPPPRLRRSRWAGISVEWSGDGGSRQERGQPEWRLRSVRIRSSWRSA